MTSKKNNNQVIIERLEEIHQILKNKQYNTTPQIEFENIPTSFSSYKFITVYRFIQVVGIFVVIIVAILVYYFLKGIEFHSRFAQIDLPSVQLLVLGSIISLCCFFYFLVGYRFKRKNKYKIKIAIIISGAISLLFIEVVATYDEIPESLRTADIVIAQFQSLVELPITLSSEGIAFPEVINVNDFINANLQRLLVEFGFAESKIQKGIKISRTKKIIRNQSEANQFLDQTDVTALIWGFSFIATGQEKIIYPLMTFRPYHRLRILDPKAQIQHGISQYEPIVTHEKDFKELEIWILYMLMEVYFKKNQNLGNDFFVEIKREFLYDFLESVILDMATELDSASKEIEKLRLKKMKEKLEVYIHAIMPDSLIKEKGITISENPDNYDLSWNQAIKLFNNILKIPNKQNIKDDDWIPVFSKLERCLVLEPNDFNATYYKGLSLIASGNVDEGISFCFKALRMSTDRQISEEVLDGVKKNICDNWDRVKDKGKIRSEYKDEVEKLGLKLPETNQG